MDLYGHVLPSMDDRAARMVADLILGDESGRREHRSALRRQTRGGETRIRW